MLRPLPEGGHRPATLESVPGDHPPACLPASFCMLQWAMPAPLADRTRDAPAAESPLPNRTPPEGVPTRPFPASRRRPSARWATGLAGCLGVLLLATATTGCDRRDRDTRTDHHPAPAPTQTPPEGTAEPAPSPASTDAAPSPTEDADPTAVLQSLTQAVRRYGVERQQVPSNLEDLVSKGYLVQIPEAPRGKRFRINRQLQVELVDK